MRNQKTSRPNSSVRNRTMAFSLIGAVALFLVVIATSQTVFVDEAKACRDCPFPTPLAKLHWLMPGGMSEVMVQEMNLGHGRQLSVVRLIDRTTGQLLAIGKLEHNKGRKRITVNLEDEMGGTMEAEVHYTNTSRTQVKIKLTCLKCNLREAYLR